MAVNRSVAVFGSTGSIGVSTLSLVREHPNLFSVFCLVAGGNVDLLVEQAVEFHPRYVGIAAIEKLSELKDKLKQKGVTTDIVAGQKEIEQLAARGTYDLMIAAIVGRAGLPSVLAAAKAGKTIALANKESLVCGGKLIKEANCDIIPVDSEHSALFQALQGQKRDDVTKLILTASGGPFLNRPRETFDSITIEEALKHPRWNMGKKVTIDSATLFNKALELIEAFWLYDVSVDQLHAIVHPQSIIHSMVEFCDGSTIAQLSYPDMRGPIGYALCYPDGRLAGSVPPMKYSEIRSLEFFEIDKEKFPAVSLAIEVLRIGKGMGAVFNAANESAVEAFLRGDIRFVDIYPRVAKLCERFEGRDYHSLEELFVLDQEVRASI